MGNKNTHVNSGRLLTNKQQEDNDRAVRMIILVACLNFAMVDVQNELEMSGRYKQRTKHYFNMANKLVMEAHDIFFRMLASQNFTTAKKQYVDHSDRTWDNINKTVFIPALEGAVNKAVSLCRLAQKYNNELRGRYDCYVVDRLSSVEKFLIGLGEHDYNMDFVVEKQLSY